MLGWKALLLLLIKSAALYCLFPLLFLLVLVAELQLELQNTHFQSVFLLLNWILLNLISLQGISSERNYPRVNCWTGRRVKRQKFSLESDLSFWVMERQSLTHLDSSQEYECVCAYVFAQNWTPLISLLCALTVLFSHSLSVFNLSLSRWNTNWIQQ